MELIYANIKSLSFNFKVSQNKQKQVINLKKKVQTRNGQVPNLPAHLQY